MKRIKKEYGLCPWCMEEHEIETIRTTVNTIFKGAAVSYEAVGFYCELTEEVYYDREQMKENYKRKNEA